MQGLPRHLRSALGFHPPCRVYQGILPSVYLPSRPERAILGDLQKKQGGYFMNPHLTDPLDHVLVATKPFYFP